MPTPHSQRSQGNTLGQLMSGPLSSLFAQGSAPTRAAIEGALLSAGLDPADYQNQRNNEALVRTALTETNGQTETAADLVYGLVDSLRKAGSLTEADGPWIDAVLRLTDAYVRQSKRQMDAFVRESNAQSKKGTKSTVAISEEPPTLDTPRPPPRSDPAMTLIPTIFLVHGHDTALRDKVENQLRRWIDPIEVVVLAQEASRGRVLVEKFEQHAKTATFAIVLATPDDEGRANGAAELNP